MAWFNRTKDENSNEEAEEASIGLISSKSHTLANERRKNTEARWQWSRTALLAFAISSNLFWIFVNLHLRTLVHRTQIVPETNFVSAQALPTQSSTVDFDDLLMWNSTSKQVYRQMNHSLPLYFGAPSPAIDAAWADLMRFEYPAIGPEEISMNPSLSFSPSDLHPATGKFHIALDVFHNLHCLNAVRKELDKDYYGEHHHGKVERSRQEAQHTASAVQAAQRDHIDHCLNHIRQTLQCRPDFSPAAMSIFTDTDGAQFFLGNSKRHTCVDWSKVMTWAQERERGLGYAPMR
ncbi:hypothetical protein E8E13_002975 [Curvularia kusanoi]|uniref:Tat pathway signal sequence n=1 Tax=Curvularia kusanoi TaxID=90978 RepID=A0A9P4TAE9_CURKU|nr:hypothetical protein E8E13_002975 [Curvularia kusanoi]